MIVFSTALGKEWFIRDTAMGSMTMQRQADTTNPR